MKVALSGPKGGETTLYKYIIVTRLSLCFMYAHDCECRLVCVIV